MNPILWQPSTARIEQANLTRFLKRLPRMFDAVSDSGYAELHRWSVDNAGEFWSRLWEFTNVIGDRGDIAFQSDQHFTEAKWFPNARLNFAENLIANRESIAIIACNEHGQRREITQLELARKVTAFADWLLQHGINAGDRVAAVLPNVPEAVIAMLGCTAIGAIWSSCSPDFGDDAICDRFSQIEPKILIGTATATYYGKQINVLTKINDVKARLPSVIQTLIVGDNFESAIANPPASFQYARLPFNHPLAILYSSGTTGAPKCIVHGAGGTLLQHLKEHQLHSDLNPDDRLFYYTTTGWMMWNWLVSGLASRATILLYDGSPLHPSNEALWTMAAAERVTHFGASAKYYAAIEKAGVIPRSHNLAPLRVIMSTGSPLLPESFEYIYRHVKPDVCLASISGGTDIISCFALGCPTRPVRKGELQAKGLGMDVNVCDDTANPIVGSPGELVCSSPFPSMPVGFWNDPGRKKYLASYFERFENIWCHGDWAEETPNGGLVIYGRSDTTLNPGGVRIGTAEIYNQIETFPEIAEALATALRKDGDEKIVLFLRIKAGQTMTAELISEVKQRLRTRCSPRHVPSFIVEASDFPRTISGKLSEIAVRSALHGEPIRNVAALANPESLAYFQSLRLV